ncbi:secreted RxLR effector protein 161-like [Nicotiana sylvestris]|uniref:secreted RxLR effector protein 161-like n=1 Tax=Nicotiana sylvestris TaxID=4096 RepID=UPI00388C371B
MEFTLHYMGIKSAFLNGYLKEEMFVKQPPRFKSEECPDHVYKPEKALYGLKKAPRAWGMSGSLLYLIASRLDIVFSVGLCARFQANPKESHLTAVKRILRYLKGTIDLCLWYLKGSNFNLVGYADVDYADFIVHSKSTSGMAHFLGSYLVSSVTKTQNYVALPTAEAEYVVAATCYAQLL